MTQTDCSDLDRRGPPKFPIFSLISWGFHFPSSLPSISARPCSWLPPFDSLGSQRILFSGRICGRALDLLGLFLFLGEEGSLNQGESKEAAMSGGSGSFLEIQPSELAFPFEIMKQSSCSMQLTNKTDHYVAFKVKTTNPKQYCVRPNIGVVLPGSTCDVTVTMQAQKESPPDMQCKDKFLVQSVAAENGATAQDINASMFNKEPGKVVDEFKLRVIYVPTTTPSPIPEDSELGSSAHPFAQENGINHSAMPQSVSRSSAETGKEKSSEATSVISKLTEEKMSAIQQNQKLRQELELLRKESSKSGGGFSITFLLVVGLLGIVVGYILKRT